MTLRAAGEALTAAGKALTAAGEALTAAAEALTGTAPSAGEALTAAGEALTAAGEALTGTAPSARRTRKRAREEPKSKLKPNKVEVEVVKEAKSNGKTQLEDEILEMENKILEMHTTILIAHCNCSNVLFKAKADELRAALEHSGIKVTVMTWIPKGCFEVGFSVGGVIFELKRLVSPYQELVDLDVWKVVELVKDAIAAFKDSYPLLK